MRRTRKNWWRTVAEERQWLTFGMSYGEVSFEARVAALTSDAGSKVAAVSRCFHGFDVVAPELGFGASVARSESSLPRSYRPYAIDCLTNR